MKPTPPPTPLQNANHEKQRAQWQRGQALTRLKNGQTTIPELIQLAQKHHHLQKLKLNTLIHTTPNTPRHVKQNWQQKTSQLTHHPTPPNPTIAWLLDKRDKNHTRQKALLETLNTNTNPPWPGWPYTPNPQNK